MKFMKLGSRPHTFCITDDGVRSVSSEVSSDLVVEVEGIRYLLHKFPLFSKCLRLQKLCSSDSPEASGQLIVVKLPDFPGGFEAFELCANFCYGFTVTLSAHNLVSARCAAEYLQMTEETEKGNLISKLETFFNSCILQGWKDSIVALQSTKALQGRSEDLGITGRCIDAISSKVLANPSKANLSKSYSRRVEEAMFNGSETQRHKSWWAEDLAELNINLYWRTMVAIKSGGRVPSNVVGDSLRIYASRWLPNITSFTRMRKDSDPDSKSSKYRLVLESIISLLPAEKGAVSCSFLLKLLKAASVLRASNSSKMEVTRRVALRLEDASVGDLLIPSVENGGGETVYDVDIVMIMLEEFLLQGKSPPTSPPRRSKGDFERRRSRSAENVDLDEFQESRRSSSSASHSSKLKVAKLFDGYLQEISRDANFPVSKFIKFAESFPDFARPDHDDLYKAIDIYLKGHPELNKSERKRICRILDCKKLSMEACMHAAQNELLPLRVVVQVLFFEQARAAVSGGHTVELPANLKALLANAAPQNDESIAKKKMSPPEDQWSSAGLKTPKTTLRMKLAEEEDDDDYLDGIYADGVGKSSRIKAMCVLPNRSKRIFSRLWSTKQKFTE
ncbi:PREDICTED: BTB/POZ domain-containing protein At1g67900-like [Ipomoea nil]|uniref:BTB/POZ domain-containing protein At1g67900-like n=1 Tax=Ipomoea nil TaxID=35883 RepID=UPI000900A0AF|nr:PREDICTED: BTB/POZ domain-containing protein At1g67900-like [Ipomoea nil]